MSSPPSSSSSPAEDPATPASSTTSSPSPGLLWVTVNIIDPHHSGIRTPPSTIESWYTAHLTDVLSCPGNGGFALRYLNTDPSINAYSDPDLTSRFADPHGEASVHGVARSGWKYLALVRLKDVMWCGSKEFNEMPRTSELLPVERDGSVGSAFSVLHAGLRTYETVDKKRRVEEVGSSSGGSGGRGKWLVSLQVTDASKEGLDAVVGKWEAKKGWKSWIAYRLVKGVLGYEEPGHMPAGMVLVEMEGDEKPVVDADGKEVVRTDVWELTVERGEVGGEL